VDHDCDKASLKTLSLNLHAAQNKFLAAGPAGVASALVSAANIRTEAASSAAGGSALVSAAERPPAGHQGVFISKKADCEMLDMSVALFRKQFSPDMHWIFPLMAYQQQLHSLDFHDVQTWVVYDGECPAGAVAWRFRKPVVHTRKDCDATSVLEVLFISVWEHYRSKKLGEALVTALEEEARGAWAGYLYVEIGHEQPLAKQFWAKNGFYLVDSCEEAAVNPNQTQFFEHMCLRFSDTAQYIKVLQ